MRSNVECRVDVKCLDSGVEEVVATTRSMVEENIMSFHNISLRIVDLLQLGPIQHNTFHQLN